jgi:asparagine synthase (glutamine-hydrolysing)
VAVAAAEIMAGESVWILGVPTAPAGTGQPPLWTAQAGDVHATFSGTLFDADDLARTLGVSDGAHANPAELALCAYQRLGDRWMHPFRGHYAVIVEDRRQDRVIAARDAMGLHPLFVARSSRGLVFSWSTEALLAQPGVSRALNRVLLAEHLLHRWSDPRETYFAAIERIPPGHLLDARGPSYTISRYWDPASGSRLDWVEDDALDRFNGALNTAVGRCLSQGPSGIFLSGGFDSISIAAVAADEASRRGDPAPHALSLGFPDPECNEEPVQRGAAQALGLQQDYIGFGTAVGDRGLLVPALEMARSWPAPMMNLWNPAYSYLAGRGAERGCRVILTGSGGDEWLAVSPFLSADLLRQGRVTDLFRFIGTTKRSYKVTTAQAAKSVLWSFGARPVAGMVINRMATAWWQHRRHERMVASTPAWVAPDPALRREVDERASRVLGAAEPFRGSFYEQQMRTALEHPLNTMEAEEYFEQGRRLGVRIMHPYWDADLVDLLYRIHPRILSKGGRAKGLVRATMARRFPALGFERQKKVHATGFYWRTMQTEGPVAWRALGSAETLAGLGVLEPKLHAATMSDLFAGKRPEESYRIWNTLHLEGWARSRD